MSTFAERQQIERAIKRLPGGYDARTSESDPWITVKGGHMKGWVRFMPEEACERFGLPFPETAQEVA